MVDFPATEIGKYAMDNSPSGNGPEAHARSPKCMNILGPLKYGIMVCYLIALMFQGLDEA